VSPEDNIPVGKPVPRIDSFEEIESGGPDLAEDEKAWPVATFRARADLFEEIEPAIPSEADTEASERTPPGATTRSRWNTCERARTTRRVAGWSR
jgi:hypothetical protein